MHARIPVQAARAPTATASARPSLARPTNGNARPVLAPSPSSCASSSSSRRGGAAAAPAALPATNAGYRRWAAEVSGGEWIAGMGSKKIEGHERAHPPSTSPPPYLLPSPPPPQADPSVVLAADVGGTNCRFVLSRLSPTALAAAAAGDDGFEAEALLAVTYPTRRHATFGDALAALEREPGFVPPAAAALAVAGPVAGNRCAMTNLAWVIDGNALASAAGVPVAVLNDFEAAGYGVLALDHGSAGGGAPSATADIVPLTDAPPVPRGPKAVLGPGTGLGQAQLLWDADDGAYRVWPSEGAHASWGGRGWKQRALAGAVEAELGYCEVEHVACGAGLERIHAFLASDQAAHRPALAGLGGGTGPDGGGPAPLAAPAITAAALATAAAPPSAPPPTPEDALALEAVDLFLAVLGAEAGAMGLRCLATGGVYLAGGITPRLIDRIAGSGGLVDAFLWPASRFSTLLRTFPLYAVTNDGLGLLGARVVAARALAKKKQ